MNFKISILVLFFYLFSSFVSNAKVYFSDKLVACSSQWSTKAGGAAFQVLGIPNGFPQENPSLCVWRPSRNTATEYVHVGFKNAVKINQIIVGNKSASNPVSTIFGYDSLGKEYLLAENTPQQLDKRNNVFHFKSANTEILIKSIKVVVTHVGVFKGLVEIDFVAIADDNEVFVPQVNFPATISFKTIPENLGENVNSKHIELLPVISADGNSLYFSRRGDPQNIEGPKDDIFKATLENGKWGKAVNLGRPLNNNGYNYLYSISPNGNELLIDDQLPAPGRAANGLSFVRKTAAGWDFPEKVIINGYRNLSEFNEFFLCNDGKTLLMSLERFEGEGSNDIYVSFLQKNSTWSIPKNIGKSINTAAPESYPFLAADGVTLYFSSSGFSSYGFNDIFVSKRLDDTWQNWSSPVNIGPVINTKGSDQNFVIQADGAYAYFVSDVNSIGLSDIYRIKLPKELKPEPVILVQGKVLNQVTKKAIASTIIYEELETGKEAGRVQSDPLTGEYKIVLPKGKKYAISAKANRYLAIEESIDLTELADFETKEKNLSLVPIEKGQKIRLNNLYFETGKAEIMPSSFVELNHLVEMLFENPFVKIKINGYTDNVGKEEDNLKLSQNRAKAIVEYLNKKGIPNIRLDWEGYGSKNELVANNSEVNKALNRRVELEIIN